MTNEQKAKTIEIANDLIGFLSDLKKHVDIGDDRETETTMETLDDFFDKLQLSLGR